MNSTVCIISSFYIEKNVKKVAGLDSIKLEWIKLMVVKFCKIQQQKKKKMQSKVK